MAIKWDDTTADDGLFYGDDGAHDDAFVIEVEAPGRVMLTTSGLGHDYFSDVAEAKTAAEIWNGTLPVESGVHRCPCCGDDTYTTSLLCTECLESGCASSRDASGDIGFWDCQQADYSEV